MVVKMKGWFILEMTQPFISPNPTLKLHLNSSISTVKVLYSRTFVSIAEKKLTKLGKISNCYKYILLYNIIHIVINSVIFFSTQCLQYKYIFTFSSSFWSKIDNAFKTKDLILFKNMFWHQNNFRVTLNLK